jgi:hypothetical protein
MKSKSSKSFVLSEIKSETTKKYIRKLLDEKCQKEIEKHKTTEASKLLVEPSDELKEVGEKDAPVDEAPPEKEKSKAPATKILAMRLSGGKYVYRFTFMSKRFQVVLEPAGGTGKYNAKYYVMGYQNSPKVTSRFGITSVSMIEPLFKIIFEAVEKFIQLRKPISVRFLPGEGISFPSSIHLYIYKPLKAFAKSLAPKYAIVRGDSTKDGSAFVVRRGVSTNIKQQSWRPGKPAAEKPATAEEQIANVTGNSVQTTIPFKPKDKKKTKIERRI